MSQADLASDEPARKENAKEQAINELYEEGMKARREVMGDEFVDRALASTSKNFENVQQYVTAACWGQVWTRPGLSRRDRSLLNLGMLCCLNRGPELAGHVRGALNNGVTEEEISELMVQVTVYAGAPASLEGARIADRVIHEWKEANLASQKPRQE